MTSVDTSFLFVRHAPVLGGAGIIHPSNAPADLGDRNRLYELSRVLPRDAGAYCSPSRRTVETGLALGLACSEIEGLREQDFGDWTGRRHDEIASSKEDSYARFWQAPASNIPPGGESFVEQIARTRSVIDGITGGAAVLIVHSGTIRAALAIALDLQPEQALRFVVAPLSLTRIDRIAGGWRVGGVNLEKESCRA